MFAKVWINTSKGIYADKNLQNNGKYTTSSPHPVKLATWTSELQSFHVTVVFRILTGILVNA